MWSSELQQTIIQRCKAVQYRLQEPLSRHTSFRIGGPAAVMAFPKTTEELTQPYILGAGTNILAPDEGLDALVICLKDALCGIRLLDEARIEAYAGESMAKAAVFAKNHALTGLEFAHGIPGTLGGGVYMNAGAYGGELKQVVESVTILTMDGEEKTLSGEECAFGYRTSVYQKLPCVIVKAEYDRADDARADGKAQSLAAAGAAVRRKHVQASDRIFCRPPHRAGRTQGLRRGWRGGIEKARGFRREYRRRVG